MLGSSAVMAAGTVVSRLSGFVRTTLLAAALGTSLHADVFNIANTIPNMLYILLVGGVFNAVLVPQLVRAMKNDGDGGHAYTNRMITLAAIFLVIVTAVLIVAAPLVMRLLLGSEYFTDPALSAHRDSAITLARYCLPQVFFYGMFVLVGQVLNARGSFGPMMWAPIANNVVSIAVLGAYLAVFHAAKDPGAVSVAGVPAHNTTTGPFGASQELLLGLGSTLGIVIQFLVLLPYLRRAGFVFRPRVDFRGSGLGHTLRLGVWTVAFVIANQIAYAVVVNIASSGTAGGHGTGYTVYANAFLLVMVPHAIITVSLATAILPRLSRLAAEDDLRGLGRTISSTMRSTYALVLPIAALLPLLALDLANLVWAYGAAARSFTDFAAPLALFALGLVFFTCHYLLLRGYYALEQTRRVFVIQCFVATTNIVAAILLTRGAPAEQTASRLVLAYTVSYAVGALLSWVNLSRQVGGLDGARMLRYSVRLLVVAGLATGLAWAARWAAYELLPGQGKPEMLVHLGLVGLTGMIAYLLLARLFRIGEVTEVVGMVTSRLRRSSAPG